MTVADERDAEPTQLTRPKKGEPVEIPVPKRSAFEELVRKVAAAQQVVNARPRQMSLASDLTDRNAG